jgi:hypothetical protein
MSPAGSILRLLDYKVWVTHRRYEALGAFPPGLLRTLTHDSSVSTHIQRVVSLANR